MSVPRIVEPSLPVFVTRRTVCRFYLLRPDRELTEGFLYCLGAAAERHGIALHAVCVMSTHVHLVFTDVRGVYPGLGSNDPTGVDRRALQVAWGRRR